MNVRFGSASQLIERLSALHRNLLRRFANEEELQLVHVEILQYLSICNHYSNTTQSISEYLGQTKGSISQSLSILEQNNFIKRVQNKVDKRIYHIVLTSKGESVSKRLSDAISFEKTKEFDPVFEEVLVSIQKQNRFKGFGICGSCKHNQNPMKNIFICGLTKEKLSIDDIKKICREHQEAI